MNINTIRKAMTKDTLRAAARLALSAEADLGENEKERILHIVAFEYLTEDEPDTSALNEYLAHLVLAETFFQANSK